MVMYANTVNGNGKYLIIHSPHGFSGIIYNTGWGTLPDCLINMQFTSNEGMRNDALIHDRPLHRALRALLFTKSVWVL